ncbi:MAG: phospholipase D-like domain-containing protein [Granulosicoccus sp.]
MSEFKTWRRFLKGRRLVAVLIASYVMANTAISTIMPPPAAVSMSGEPRKALDVVFLNDESWLDAKGNRQLSQQLFDQVLFNIDSAERLILLDMFLFNDWQGPIPESHRSLASELTDALVKRKQAKPEIDVIVISDPINTVYQGLPSTHFERLKAAGVKVSLTDLTKLQDSNPAWSGLWRWLIRPFGNSEASTLANPFGAGKVSLRSYFALFNFKANHRKLLITDNGSDQWRALVSSANPHDGSSAHRNVALEFGGKAVHDLMLMELALLRMNQSETAADLLENHMKSLSIDGQSDTSPDKAPTIQMLGESKIHDAIIDALSSAGAGDGVDLAMFYLSERQIVESLKAAQRRGATIRVLLDVNSDAFGRKKNGVPNLPVAAELHASGIPVRWCATAGEQCHAKWFHLSSAGTHTFIMGSANFTRRNLLDFNLETDVRLQTQTGDVITSVMRDFFEQQWNNTQVRTYSLPYEAFGRDSLWLTAQYRFMEATGLSTF